MMHKIQVSGNKFSSPLLLIITASFLGFLMPEFDKHMEA